jgi:hypothetical protein
MVVGKNLVGNFLFVEKSVGKKKSMVLQIDNVCKKNLPARIYQ